MLSNESKLIAINCTGKPKFSMYFVCLKEMPLYFIKPKPFANICEDGLLNCVDLQV